MRLVCGGCGYRYDPGTGIGVYNFVTNKGGGYIACEKCFARVECLKRRDESRGRRLDEKI